MGFECPAGFVCPRRNCTEGQLSAVLHFRIAREDRGRNTRVDVEIQPIGCLSLEASATKKFAQQHVEMVDAILALYGISAAVVG